MTRKQAEEIINKVNLFGRQDIPTLRSAAVQTIGRTTHIIIKCGMFTRRTILLRSVEDYKFWFPTVSAMTTAKPERKQDRGLHGENFHVFVLVAEVLYCTIAITHYLQPGIFPHV